jgi:hypothetical protein
MGNQLRILLWSMFVKMGKRRRMLIKLLEVKAVTSRRVEGRSSALKNF